MKDWPLSPSYYQYRALRKGLNGWDTFAAQSALQWCGYDVGPAGIDGWFGDWTDKAARQFQTDRQLTVDGIIGIMTQSRLALAASLRIGVPLPAGLYRGVFTFEGGNQLGNHTAPYKDGSRDFGIVQDNLPDDLVNRALGFNVPGRLQYYANETKATHDKYAPYVSDRRAWELAAGHWNRPAHTDYLANPTKWPLRNPDGTKRDLTQAERDWIEGYIDRVTTYVVWA